MRNDLLVLEYEYGDREALISPEAVLAVAKALEETLLRLHQVLGSSDSASVQIFIAAVERGSIRIGFRAIWVGLDEEALARRLGMAADAFTVGTGFLGILVWAGIALGVIHPLGPDPQERPQIAQIAQAPDITEHVRAPLLLVIEAASKSGADQVTVRVPDAPSGYLLPPNTQDSKALGSWAIRYPTYWAAPEQSVLELLPASFEADVWQAGATRRERLFVGRIACEGTHLNVLVSWQSRRPPPVVGERVTVKGQLRPLNEYDITPRESVPHDARSAVGILLVQSQIVEE